MALKPLDAPRRDSVVRSHSAMRFDDLEDLVDQEENAREEEDEIDEFELFCKQAGRRKLSSCADWGGSLPDIPKASSPGNSLAHMLLKKRLHAPLGTHNRSKSMKYPNNKSGHSHSRHGKLHSSFKGIINKPERHNNLDTGSYSVPHSRSGSLRRSKKYNRHEEDSNSGSRPDSLILPDDIPDDHYLVRQFVSTKKGIVNRGDSIRSCSTSSMRSLASGGSDAVAANDSSNDSDGSPHGRTQSPLASNPARERHMVLILGPRGVGKTTLIKQFRSTECSADADPVLEDALSTSVSVLLDGKESTLDFIDIPYDQEPTLREDLSCYLVVYSIADKETFHSALDLLLTLRKQHPSSSTSPPIILVANKTDLVRTKEVSTKEGKSAAEHYNCKFTEASASLNMQVDDLLAGILKQIRLHRDCSHKKIGKHGHDTREHEVVPYDKHQSRSPFAFFGKFLKRHISGDEHHSCDNLMVL